jgi:hypothetical protein
MKQILPLLFAVFILASCNKEASQSNKKNGTDDNLLLQKVTYSRKDTVTQHQKK